MPALIVGRGAAVRALAATAAAAGIEVTGQPLDPEAAMRDDPAISLAVDRVLVATAGVGRDTLAELALRCTGRGVAVWLDTAELPELRDLLSLEPIGDRTGVVLRGRQSLQPLRRAIDVVLAASALVMLVPLLGLVAALVKLSSPGPVLHRAVVVGQDGRPFTWYKFRTMRVAGEDEEWRRRRFAEFVRGGEAPAKIIDESRVTAVGAVLRRHSLDELPQLWSVLKGDMTLIGPRPCLVYEYELLKPWHRGRFAVRPGLTGLWQVRGRGRVHADTMAFMDICYALGRTWRTDLRLVRETLAVILSGRGAA